MADHRPHPGSGDTLSADLIAQRGFATMFRGFDPAEVREFLQRVAAEVRDLRDRVERAEAARREAEERALHPTLDEETLLAAVGDETASILRTARGAANEIKAKAEEQATTLLREAQAEVGALRSEAEAILGRRTAEAEAAAELVRATAITEAERLRVGARQEAEAIRQQSDQERRLTIEAAQTTREKILTDLGRRRRVANVQVEQLRAGRERLLDAYLVVRRTLDEVTDELQRADSEARAAADEVGRKAAEDPTDLGIDLSTGVAPVDQGAAAEVDRPEDHGTPEDHASPEDHGTTEDSGTFEKPATSEKEATPAGDPVTAEVSAIPVAPLQAAPPPIPPPGDDRGRARCRGSERCRGCHQGARRGPNARAVDGRECGRRRWSIPRVGPGDGTERCGWRDCRHRCRRGSRSHGGRERQRRRG